MQMSSIMTVRISSSHRDGPLSTKISGTGVCWNSPKREFLMEPVKDLTINGLVDYTTRVHLIATIVQGALQLPRVF